MNIEIHSGENHNYAVVDHDRRKIYPDLKSLLELANQLPAAIEELKQKEHTRLMGELLTAREKVKTLAAEVESLNLFS